MTELDLDAIEALVAAATRGPWVLYPTITRLDGNELAWTISRPYCEKANDGPCDDDCGVEVLRTGAEECEEDWMRADDASFIASARTDVPALVAEVRRLRAAMDAALALADELDTNVRLLENDPPSDWPDTRAYENGRLDSYQHAAERLRAALTDADPTEEDK